MKWHETILDTVDSAISYVQSITSERRWAHRGQASAKWNNLLPSIARTLPSDYSQSRRLHVEKQSADMFRSLVAQYLDYSDMLLLASPLQSYVLMQHYGAPTRLLDWTSSPWVALYFAVAALPTEDAHLWSFCLDSLSMEGLRALPQNLQGSLMQGTREAFLATFYADVPSKYIQVLEPLHKNARLAAQQSCFTVACDLREDHANLLASALSPAQQLTKKAVISATIKPPLLDLLDSMNISPSALFPGPDGIGASIANFVSNASKHRGNQFTIWLANGSDKSKVYPPA